MIGIRLAAVPAWLDLQYALMALPSPTPCAVDPDAWCNPQPEDVAYLTGLCNGCPVLALCDAFATTNRETAGIWAGRSREPTRGRPAANNPKGETA